MKHHVLTAATVSILLGACANQLPYQPYQALYPVYPSIQQPTMPVSSMNSSQSTTINTTATTPVATGIGNQLDEYGCQTATGATWSVLMQQCVQLFNVANIRMVDPENPSLAAYAIFSKDKKQAEIFSATLPKGIILNTTKGGFISHDEKIRLVDLGKNNWKLVRKK